MLTDFDAIAYTNEHIKEILASEVGVYGSSLMVKLETSMVGKSLLPITEWNLLLR